MASVNYLFIGRKDVGSLTVRFGHGRALDLKCITNISVPKKSWDAKKQRVRNVGEMKDAAKVNEKLSSLEAALISQFTLDYMDGIEIDSTWLKRAVMKFFNRPAHELEQKQKDLTKIFFTDFCQAFHDDILEKGKWKNPKTKKPLAYKSVQHYKTTVVFLKEYEALRKKRIRHLDLNLDFCEDFCEFLATGTPERKGYGKNYISKVIGRIKFFGNRAEESNIDINKVYKSRMFSAPTEETVDPYLNEKELDAIFNLDFKLNEKYGNVRDWLIIGCYTGLRVSDLLGDAHWEGLGMDNVELDVKGDYYIHLKTKKTGAVTTIPLHNRILEIIKRRGGEFPRKISSQKFNQYVKDVCKEAGLNEIIVGSVKDPETNRKVKKEYPKYETVSSHICRRSFATNHYGKLPTTVIMKIGAWRTESAFLKYLKKSNFEAAQELRRYWDETEDAQLRKVE